MAAHGLVWFDARLRSGYMPRATLKELWQQYLRFGRWKVRYWRATGDRPVPRQRVALALPVLPLIAVAILAVRRPAALMPFVAASAVGLAVVDTAGSGRGPSVATRGWAMAATVAVTGGWWVGVVREVSSAGGTSALGP